MTHPSRLHRRTDPPQSVDGAEHAADSARARRLVAQFVEWYRANPMVHMSTADEETLVGRIPGEHVARRAREAREELGADHINAVKMTDGRWKWAYNPDGGELALVHIERPAGATLPDVNWDTIT